jgi:hypothetical protein
MKGAASSLESASCMSGSVLKLQGTVCSAWSCGMPLYVCVMCEALMMEKA